MSFNANGWDLEPVTSHNLMQRTALVQNSGRVIVYQSGAGVCASTAGCLPESVNSVERLPSPSLNCIDRSTENRRFKWFVKSLFLVPFVVLTTALAGCGRRRSTSNVNNLWSSYPGLPCRKGQHQTAAAAAAGHADSAEGIRFQTATGSTNLRAISHRHGAGRSHRLLMQGIALWRLAGIWNDSARLHR